jgi:hypothetical protein
MIFNLHSYEAKYDCIRSANPDKITWENFRLIEMNEPMMENIGDDGMEFVFTEVLTGGHVKPTEEISLKCPKPLNQ